MATNDCIKGIIVGGLIGVVLGILYAPKSGKETREDICNTTGDLYEKTKEQCEQTVAKLERLISCKKESLMETKERLKKALEAGVGTFKEKQSGTSTQA